MGETGLNAQGSLHIFHFSKLFYYFFMCVSAYMYDCAPCMCLVALETRRGYQIT